MTSERLKNREDLTPNGTCHFLVYTDDNSVRENRPSTKKTPIRRLYESAQKIKYACMPMCRHWDAGQAYNAGHKSDENLEPQLQIASIKHSVRMVPESALRPRGHWSAVCNFKYMTSKSWSSLVPLFALQCYNKQHPWRFPENHIRIVCPAVKNWDNSRNRIT